MATDRHHQEEIKLAIPQSGNLELVTGSIPCEYSKHYVSVTVFDDFDGEFPIVPTAGTAVITATDDGFNYGDVTNGKIDLRKPNYPRPNFSGRITSVKCNINGIQPVGDHDGHQYYWVCLRVHSYK